MTLPSKPEVPEGVVLREEPPPERSPTGVLPPLGVPPWAPLPAVLLVLIGQVLLAALIGSVFGIAGADADTLEENDALTVVITILVDGVLILAPVVVVTWLAHHRPDPAAFGLRIPDWRSALGSTAMIYAGFWACVLIIGLIAGEAEDQDIVNDIQAEDSVPLLAGFVVMTCIAAPLAEEFFFRGFVFKVLWERTNVSAATIGTGVIFGLVHLPGGDWIGVAVLTCLGAGLCLLFWRTASLLPCIMLHSFHNSISFGFTKGLPWWLFLLVIAGSVGTTLAIFLLATRLSRRGAPSPVPA